VVRAEPPVGAQQVFESGVDSAFQWAGRACDLPFSAGAGEPGEELPGFDCSGQGSPCPAQAEVGVPPELSGADMGGSDAVLFRVGAVLKK
jgi:hypothetical protein